ncbi:MAG: SDR family oxidoreductase [Gammaproteobacteria bacterium]|nr:SDR family oxidoreductase [Gammaproteobacteria bacterium]
MRASILALVLLLAGPALAGDLVLVAGATGGTGRQVVAELAKAGFEVRALVRDPAAARPVLGDQIAYATGDVRERATLDAALKGVRYLVTTIGATRTDPANGPEFVDYEGVRKLAEAAAAAGIARHVLVSSAGVTREDHILNRMFANVLVWKGKGEAAVRASGVPYTIVRPGGLTNQPGGRAGIRLEQGDAGTGFIPRADVARICVAALGSPAARNRTFEAYSASTGPDVDWDTTFSQLAADGATP